MLSLTIELEIRYHLEGATIHFFHGNHLLVCTSTAFTPNGSLCRKWPISL